MPGPFGDPSDANRKRGPRPFAGQVHPPGSGPLKGNRVRRPTLAPFPSPFAEERPEPPAGSVQPPVQPHVPETGSLLQAVAPDAFTAFKQVPAAPELPAELPLPPAAGAEGQAPLEPSLAEESETPEPLHAAFSQNEDDGAHYETLAEAEPEEPAFGRYAETEPLEPEWSAVADEDVSPASALYTDELRGLEVEPEQPADVPPEAVFNSDSDVDAEDDWFTEAGHPGHEDDVDDAPFDTIESIGTTPRSLAAEGAEASAEPLPVPLPVDWAVSPDGEAALQRYVAASRVREDASDVLEAVARRVRSGEIVLALEPGASAEAVLASVLASLLT